MDINEFYVGEQPEVSLEDPNLQQQDIGYVPIEGEYDTPSLVSGLLALNRPDEAKPEKILGSSEYVAENNLVRQEAIAQEEDSWLRAGIKTVEDIDRMSGGNTAVSIGYNGEGRKQITLDGSRNPSAEFQGLGKYATPEEFMRLNPEGFKNTNPVLYQRMQAEAQARAEAPNKLAMQITGELDAKMQAITAEKDPLKKQAMIGELRTSAAIAAANMTKQMRILAEDKAGLATLQQQFLRQQKLDMMDPLLVQMGKNSPATLQVARQLQQAKQSVAGLTKQMIAENPTLAAMDSKLKVFLAANERSIIKDMERHEKDQEKIDAVAGSLTPEAIKNLGYVFPDVSDATTAAKKIAVMAKNPTWKKEWGVVLDPSFQNTDLLPMAAQGSRVAQTILTRQEMEKTGRSLDEVKADVSKFMKVYSSDADALAVLKKLPPSDTRNQMVKAMQMLSLSHDKESNAQRQAIRFNAAMEYAKMSRMNSTLGDVQTWSGDINLRSDPAAAAAIDKLKTISGKGNVRLDDFIGEYVNTVPKEQRAARMDHIKAAADSHAAKYKDSVFGSIDQISLRNAMQAKVSWSSKLSDVFSGIQYDNLVPPNMMGGIAP